MILSSLPRAVFGGRNVYKPLKRGARHTNFTFTRGVVNILN